MGLAGLACSFLPHELLQFFGVVPSGVLPVIVQLLGALYFSFAMVNWTARGSLIGGIYNRPVALGNLTHFVVGALALVKTGLAGDAQPLTFVAIVYALFAIAFTLLFFRSPVQRAA